MRNTPSKGFTLVETLIAVTVLMIAIAGPLVVASKGLTAALISRDQMTASLLAQETIELVKNTRDNNITSGSAWNTTISNCLAATTCDFDALLGVMTYPCDIATQPGCRLYFTPNGYTNSVSSSPTIFYRYFYLTPRGADEYTLTAVVSWYRNTILNEVRLSSELTSTIR